jgi:hypothetical protein
MTDELSFWAAVGLVAIVALALFKFVAAKLGGRVPALADLAAFV